MLQRGKIIFLLNCYYVETENDCVEKTEAFVGWQRNDEGKLNFKRINLSDEMDPKKYFF